jgi:spore coat polysaccharide biosynthesis predicted glycosyltransferase SpsG
MKPDLFLRADGSIHIGYGHVYRLLAISQMLRSHFNVHFVTRANDPSLLKAISDHATLIQIDHNVDEPADKSEWAFLEERAIIILDGYQFDTDYQDSLMNLGHILLVIDDIQTHQAHANLLINHAPGLIISDYKGHHVNDFLLGPRYAILRSEFLDIAKTERIFPKNKHLFICFGGGVHQEPLHNLIHFLANHPSVDGIHVLMGNNVELPPQLNSNKINCYSGLDANQVISLANQCCIAITSASTISYEMACIGIPLFLKKTVDNQKFIFNGMLDLSIALEYNLTTIEAYLNLPEEEAKQYFISFATRQRLIFDGKSGTRLAAEIKNCHERYL